MKVRRLLSREVIPAKFANAPIIAQVGGPGFESPVAYAFRSQFSSMGSLSKKWLDEELAVSLGASAGGLKAPVKLRMVWPSVEVRTPVFAQSLVCIFSDSSCRMFAIRWRAMRQVVRFRSRPRTSSSTCAPTWSNGTPLALVLLLLESFLLMSSARFSGRDRAMCACTQQGLVRFKLCVIDAGRISRRTAALLARSLPGVC